MTLDKPSAEGAPPTEHWFERLADHLGPAYLRYSFTKGTVQEVDSICELSGVSGGRVLDVGCGPGRHSLEFARRGFDVVGVDISSTFVDLASDAAAAAGLERCRFVRGDARNLIDVDGVAPGSFDLVVSLCQGAFGLTGGPAASEIPQVRQRELDEPILSGMARAVAPPGRIVVSAFSSYFQMRHSDPAHANSEAPDGAPPEHFDAVTGVNHEWTSVMDADGVAESAELWTTCYTPRELRLLARLVGLEPLAVYGVTPGRYGAAAPTVDCPEFLLIAQRGIHSRSR